MWKGSSKIISIFLSAVLIFLLSGCSKDDKVEIPASSVQVIDGDTIKVRMKGKEDTVRFLLVDAPETHNDRLGKQPLGDEAKEFTEQMIKHAKKIELEKDQSTRDNYGRFLAYVYADGKSVQEELLKNGFARVAYVYKPNTKYAKEYEEFEQQARNKKVGIWQWDEYVRKDGFHPEATRNVFAASKNSDVYHPADCYVVKDIKPDNLIYFYSEASAKASGRHRSDVKGCWAH